jgi:hypothetical protein
MDRYRESPGTTRPFTAALLAAAIRNPDGIVATTKLSGFVTRFAPARLEDHLADDPEKLDPQTTRRSSRSADGSPALSATHPRLRLGDRPSIARGLYPPAARSPQRKAEIHRLLTAGTIRRPPGRMKKATARSA